MDRDQLELVGGRFNDNIRKHSIVLEKEGLKVYLCMQAVYGSFNDPLSSSYYTAPNERMINELERTWMWHNLEYYRRISLRD
jgi:hypothetical protein